MELMMPTDSMFLFVESREHPIHVGGLSLFEPPEGAGPDFVRNFYEALVANDEFQPTFRKHPATIGGGIARVAWAYDDDLDVDYHVRRSALPSPGRVRDLLELASRLHTSLLDRHRPLWELHVVEGLSDGRFAMYAKMHHALIDGVSAAKLMQRTMSADSSDTEVRAMWNLPRPPRPKSNGGGSSLVGSLVKMAGSVAGLAPSTLKLARAALFEQQLTLPFAAPHTMFNVKVGGARRCAAQSWSLERIRAVKEAAGVTVNDAVLAMCAGALRYYLIEQDALPDAPLIAMVPVSLRSKEQADSGGNMVGSVLCNLGTNVEDPAQRIEIISASMRANKKVLADLPRLQVLALSGLNMAPLTLAGVPGFLSTVPPPFNIVISNVPGGAQPLYYGGARLDGSYPLSNIPDGQAPNITLVNNADRLDFGLVGCRRSVPSLQRLLGHLETSLKDLEQAVGV
ncbi:wax ester/triacylglycerol synthase family O-acyltransferase [Mycobacterium ulcerans]|uniref:WS/DGAT/MGAT family O-acyltransferase n=1 Tax=Mycobacterium ulcerans TaxID=1809 RepID=UPI0012DF8EAA|nr:wax ester/triacylglycerol synthase family O-acyltransferase [Mycobacterium ulcerans]MEB3967269.1 wax ester/triacylglycerol synthase family O-acyltransferase [Mycobacterium ulcerans]MEB3975553.1 wax ester/triacylglycerol synthase family O-acyltransferase [Mycobacterium ulcerans]MEB4004824.1 wax ester/triacylglycerol synthase family O-acyltransferase [Mycobacterium ulcerans]MEB4414393.1 wax ester/triacylglycerol synthase family O-acyltransferase [Mycobacterium ulcerans]MEB4432524.1 wax ester/